MILSLADRVGGTPLIEVDGVHVKMECTNPGGSVKDRVAVFMLSEAMRRGDLREVVGQLPRIVAAILFSRVWVPRGNSGRARVGAFKPMPVPDDLRHLAP